MGLQATGDSKKKPCVWLLPGEHEFPSEVLPSETQKAFCATWGQTVNNWDSGTGHSAGLFLQFN